MSDPHCPNCGLTAELLSGKHIYKRRPEFSNKYFWACKPCNAHVGCHPGTTKPLGPLAQPLLRKLRMDAHYAFDPIWRRQAANGVSKRKARNHAYAWLSSQLNGAQSNIGEMDEEMCKRVIAICEANKVGPFIDPSLGDT